MVLSALGFSSVRFFLEAPLSKSLHDIEGKGVLSEVF